MTSKRTRWIALGAGAVALVLALLAFRAFTGRFLMPNEHLAQVLYAEQPGFDKNHIQTVGASLAALGLDDEVRQTDFLPGYEMRSLTVNPNKLTLNVVPWREGMEKIAANHQLVMISEDHFVSKHREMIGATLPIFKTASFTHYAVEAIGEPAAGLKRRGYPVVSTGFYTSDPQFGNALRRAIALKLNVRGYDFDFSSHEAREEFAATELAKLFQDDPQTRLLVHAGGGHILKNKTPSGQRWLASILWEKTGVEPFTIGQLSAMRNDREYEALLPLLEEQVGSFTEPILLMPPPKKDAGLINIPDVDAILFHPPDRSVAPANRTTLFPQEMLRVSGKWLTTQWPIVVAAYKQGEPIKAIPLDQVMLRRNEQDFSLWLPSATKFRIVVFDQNGVLDSSTEGDNGAVTVRAN